MDEKFGSSLDMMGTESLISLQLRDWAGGWIWIDRFDAAAEVDGIDNFGDGWSV